VVFTLVVEAAEVEKQAGLEQVELVELVVEVLVEQWQVQIVLVLLELLILVEAVVELLVLVHPQILQDQQVDQE
jgi:hypothetical protein